MTAKPGRSPVYIALGTLALIGAVVPSASIEHIFGRAPGSLAWGPSLFRALLVLHGCLLLLAGFAGAHFGGGSPGKRIPRNTLLLLSVMTAAAIILRIPNLDSSL